MDIKQKNKIKKIIRWSSAAIIILILILIIIISRINHYDKSGKRKFNKLEKTVKVIRDHKNIAYIHGQSLLDAISVQGYVTAQDRLFQLMVTRLFVSGRMAELEGKDAINRDIKNRTLGFYRHAFKHEKILNTSNRNLLQAYADGINEYIDSQGNEHPLEFKLAGIKPEKWQIIDSLAIIYYMGWNSAANLETEILSFLIATKIGFEKFKTIAPTQTGIDGKFIPPNVQNTLPRIAFNNISKLELLLNDNHKSYQIGSNSWVVNGQRSKSGKPILANDPHLDSRLLPGVFHPIGIITPKVRAVGVSIAGIPGIMIGRNQYVALGMTNSYGDAQDLYLEKIDPENPNNYLEGIRSIPFEKIQHVIKYRDKKSKTGFSNKKATVRLTRRGPVITDVYSDLPGDAVLSARWSAAESMLPELGLDCLLTAKNIKDVRKIIENISVIHLNYTFADIDGNIAWQTSGKLPIRKQGDGTLPFAVKNSQDNWLGWIPFQEMPQQENPTANWLGNTNNKIIGADFPHYISSYFSPRYRYDRMRQLIESNHQKHDAADFWEYQRDISNELAKAIVPVMINAIQNDPETLILAEALKNWDFKDNHEDVGPTIFHHLFEKMAELTFYDELGAETGEKMLNQWYFWLERFEKMILEGNSVWFDDIQTEMKKETLNDIILQAAKSVKKQLSSKLRNDIHSWRWGIVHQISFKNPIRRNGFGTSFLGEKNFAISGSNETLYRSNYDFQKPEETTVTAALRMVIDLNDKDKFLAVIPGGVTGRTFDSHFKDQLKDYMKGHKVYWWFSDQMIRDHQKFTQIFLP